MDARWRAIEREKLLARRSQPVETHVTVEDGQYLVNDKLKRSHNAIDEILAQGTSILGSLRNQRADLHGMKRKALDIGQKLGLSTSTLRMIEQMMEEDWLLFIVLVVLFLVFMYCFYRFWKG